MIQKIVIPGEPVPKGRPRFTRDGRTYTPKKTARHEAEVKLAWKRCGYAPFPAGTPIRMDVRFTMQMPKSWSGKKRAAIDGTPCVKHVDIDNLLKTVQDALNGLAFADDSQVVMITADKRWGQEGQTEVVLVGEAEEAKNETD